MKRVLLFAAAILSGCSGGGQDISASLAGKVAHGGGDVIDLSQLGPSSWQRVCVLPPYTTNDRAAQILGFRWDAQGKTGIDANDTFAVLVFVQGTEVVAYTKHPRNQGDLSLLKPPCLTRSSAKVARSFGQAGWVYLTVPQVSAPR